MIQHRIALRSLKHLCTFIGAIVLFSYFFNLTVDIRHWFITLASAFVCSILWLSFYMLELHKETATHVLFTVRRASLELLSQLRTKRAESPSKAKIDLKKN